MTAVCIDEDLKKLPHIDKLAKGVLVYEHTYGKVFPSFLGRKGDFNENPQARSSGLLKLHFLPSEDKATAEKWANIKSDNPYNLTSDHFIIYARHLWEEDFIKILGIVTPNAHQRTRQNSYLISSYIEKAEYFYTLDRPTLERICAFTDKDLDISVR